MNPRWATGVLVFLLAGTFSLAGEKFEMNPELATLGDNTWKKMNPKFVYHPDQLRILKEKGWTLKDLPKKPGGRFAHIKGEACFCYDQSANVTLYFGGCTSGYGNNHWVYDCSKNVWTQIHPDVFKLKKTGKTTWRYREDTRSHPPGFCSYGICYDSSRKVSVIARNNGGATGWVSRPGPPNNQAWLYDATKKQWLFAPRNGKIPDVYITGVRLAFDPVRKECVLFSGSSRSLWGYDTEKNRWRKINAKGPKPSKRGQPSWVYMGEEKKFLLFGGQRKPKKPREDSKPPRSTWLYDPATEKWEDITSEKDPLTRSMAAAAYDNRNNVVVMIGGAYASFSKKLNDGTWIFDPVKKTWTQHKPNPTPKVYGNCYQMAYDKTNNVMIYVTKAQTWVYRYMRAKKQATPR